MDTILCFKSKLAEIIYLNEKKKKNPTTHTRKKVFHMVFKMKKKIQFLNLLNKL